MFEFPPSLIAPFPSSAASSSLPLIPLILVDSRSACLAESGELIASKIAEEDVVEIGGLLDSEGGLKADEETRGRVGELRKRGRSLFKCVSSSFLRPFPRRYLPYPSRTSRTSRTSRSSH